MARVAYPVLLTLVALLLKLAVLSSELELSSFSTPALTGNLAWLLLLVLPLALLGPRKVVPAALLVSLTCGVVALLDLGFHRYFHDLPSARWLAEAEQLLSVVPTVRSLFHGRDLGLFADTLILGLLLWHFPPGPGTWRCRLAVFGAGLVVAAALWRVPPAKPHQTPVFATAVQTARAHGLMRYHALDLGEQLVRPWTRWRQPADLPDLLERGRVGVASVAEPSAYFGLARGHNVLVVLLESWQGFTLDMEVEGMKVMPSMSAYKKRCLVFPRYYDQTHQAGSSDGEFLMNLSLHPANRGAAVFLYESDTFHGLPRILAEHGYRTAYAGYYDAAFWNARRMTASYGFQHQFFEPFGAPPLSHERIGWSLADYPLLRRAFPLVTEGSSPFFAMVKCSMAHHPWQELEDEQKFLKLSARMDGAILGDYLQMCRFRDQELSHFLYDFERSPLAQNTVLILTGDHAAPLTQEELEPLLPADKEVRPLAYAAMQRVPLLIRLPSGKAATIETTFGQLDFAPTLCHLLGVTPREPVFLGRNAFAGSTMVAMRKLGCVTDGEVLVSLGQRSALDLDTGRLLPFEKASALAQAGKEQWSASDEILEHDLIPWLMSQPAASP